MRVFHLVKGLGRGGAETLLVRTAATPLRSPRKNAYGYFLPWKDALVPELQAQGCLVRCFTARNPLEMVLRLPQLVSFLKDWRPDLIHCHLPLAGVIGRLAGKILGVPVVYTEHNLQERYHPLTRWANRLTWTMQERAVAVSAEVMESISRRLPSQTGVQTILNGVDCEVFSHQQEPRERLRAEMGLSEADFLVGTVAVFRKQKRLDLWLQAARKLAQEFQDIHFVMVGDGPERPMVERLVEEYSLSSRVHLPGLRTDVRDFYSAMDAFFMSSDFEGLPVALLEAMACQAPAVATTAGGIGEVIVDESQGLLAEKGDVEALVEHLRKLHKQKPFRDSLASGGRARVESAFSLEKMNNELETLYYEVTGRHVPGPPAPSLDGFRLERKPSDEESLELIRASLGEGSERSPRTLEFYRWKHNQSPFGESYALSVRDAGADRLAGLRLFQRWNLACDSRIVSAVRAVDTSTHPDFQRKGIFTFLSRKALEELAADGTDIVFNTPNKNSLPGYLKMGWELSVKIPVWAKWLSGKAQNENRQAARSLDELVENHSVESIESLLFDCRRSGKLEIEKHLAYLRWRYEGHPTVRYHFKAVGTDRLEALVVWCETKRFSLRELVVCELFARTAEVAEQLLRDIFESSTCHYAVSAFWNPHFGQSLIRRLGFLKLPMKSIALTVHPLSENGRSAVDSSNWVFSTGDLQVF